MPRGKKSDAAPDTAKVSAQSKKPATPRASVSKKKPIPEAVDAEQTNTLPTSPAKKASTKAAEDKGVAQSGLAPAAKATAAKSSRRKAKTDSAATTLASSETATPLASQSTKRPRRQKAEAPAPTLPSESPSPAPPEAMSPTPKRRGRQPKGADPESEAGEIQAQSVSAPSSLSLGKRRGRPAKAAEPTPEREQPTVGEPLPEPNRAEVEADPLILEVPKPRRNVRKKAALPAPLPEVLEGVQEVPVEPEAPAALAVTHTTKEPLVDSPATLEKDHVPSPTSPHRADAAATVFGGNTETSASGDAVVSSDPEQELLIGQLRKLGRPVHVRDLEKTFTRQALERLGGWRHLAERLEDLVESGQVIRTRKKTYGLPEAMSLVRGRFQASAAGFGFVIPDSGGDDFYIPADKTMEAWNGDIVLVRMEGRGDGRDQRGARRGQKGDGNPRASVVRFVQRAYHQLVGTLEFHHGHPILKPDDHRARHRILMLPEGLEGLEAGARVVSELYWPEHSGEDEVFGKVVRVLGAEDDPVTETEAVIVKYGLRGAFPDEVVQQAEAIPVEIPEEALKGRLDLRGFNIFTVDGRDAKDFDDAIHIQPTPDGNFVVGVHIADVSHYVREGTPLDAEAYARATSVYLPGRVLPMLPEHLSNGVCSLVPYQDRLTMTTLVELSAEGDILHVQIAPSVINSKARLTYDEVQAYSEAIATLPESARQLEGDLHLLLKITSKLRQKRLREGSLDFKLREVKVDVDQDGRMELIPIREETARGMIEDLMLLANKVVAHHLLEREIPTLFRIHEEPTLQRFQEVSGAIGRLGLAFPGNEPTPQAYQTVLKQVRGTGRESVVNTLLLRSMQQAKYAGENLGHFGLAFDEYLHFTSPIRRYPDLVVHRTLKAVLDGEFRAGSREVAQFQSRLPAMGEHTSDGERKAAEAERDLTKYYQCKWAQEHLGESFLGNVSGVVASGIYVTLDNGVEGKLHISYLDDDYYVFIEDAQMLKGRRTGRSFRLGDSVNITIQEVRPLARQIELVLADPSGPEYKLGEIDLPQESKMTEIKPRARRREEREAEHREKLKSVQLSPPKKFTLDDPAPTIQSSPQSTNRGGYQRQRPQSHDPRPESRFEQRGRGGAGRDQRSESRPGSGPTFGGVSMGHGGSRGSSAGHHTSGNRRVITLERPRNEHLRPVNITVQRMYFGDWTLDNLPPDEGPTQARGGRERGYNRQERNERGAQSGGTNRGWTRGSSDRGAVRQVNGSANSSLAASTGDQRAALPATPRAATGEEGSGASTDDSKRRRRRRGRRPGSGSTTE